MPETSVPLLTPASEEPIPAMAPYIQIAPFLAILVFFVVLVTFASERSQHAREIAQGVAEAFRAAAPSWLRHDEDHARITQGDGQTAERVLVEISRVMAPDDMPVAAIRSGDRLVVDVDTGRLFAPDLTRMRDSWGKTIDRIVAAGSMLPRNQRLAITAVVGWTTPADSSTSDATSSLPTSTTDMRGARMAARRAAALAAAFSRRGALPSSIEVGVAPTVEPRTHFIFRVLGSG